VGVLLGTDVPQLSELLIRREESPNDPEKAMIMTRAQAREKKEREDDEKRKEQECGVFSNQLMDDGRGKEEQWLRDMHENLFNKPREKRKLSRAMKREAKRVYNWSKGGPNLSVEVEKFKQLQKTDPTLESVRKEACETNTMHCQSTYLYWNDGTLYRHWIPPGREGEEMAVEQLVLPAQCRDVVLTIAHSIPLAGHLSMRKSIHSIIE
jgi:hypothetical protein